MNPTSKSSESPHVESQIATDKARRRLIVIWTWVGAILLGAVALYIANLLSIAIGIVIWTAVFVFMLRGPVNWLDRHGVSRLVGTTASYVLFAAVIGALIFVMFSPTFGISAQFEELAQSLPSYIEGLRAWANEIYEQHAEFMQNDQVQSWIDGASASAANLLREFASSSAASVVSFGTSLANILLCVGFALVVAFWMLIDLPKLGREAYRLIGDRLRPDAEMIHHTVTRVMGGYLRTTLIQCGIIGLLCGIMFALLGVPSPAALGVITGLLNIIPIIGPWLGGILAFVASVVTSPITGVVALIGTIIIQQLIYTFLSPKLMGDSVDIHPALTFIALMAGSGIGTAMGGMIGALVGTLLSIPLVAVAKSIFIYYFEKRTGRRIVAEDGVFFKGVAEETAEVDPRADAAAPTPAPGTTGRIFPLPDISGRLPGLPIDAPDDSEGREG